MSSRARTHTRTQVCKQKVFHILFHFTVFLRFYNPLTENVVDKREFLFQLIFWIDAMVLPPRMFTFQSALSAERQTKKKRKIKSCFFFIVHLRDGLYTLILQIL